MKRIIFVLSAVLLLPVYLAAQTGEELDNANGTSMMPIVNNLVEVVKAMEQSEVEIVHIEFDILKEDGSKEIYRNFSEGYSYGILTYGDYRITQIGIDLYVKSGDSWEYVKSGELVEGAMSLLHKVEATNQFKIVLRPLEFASGYSAGHYGLLVLHD